MGLGDALKDKAGGILGRVVDPLGLVGKFENAASAAKNLNDGPPEYVVKMQKGKSGPEEYYRVDQNKDGTFKAKKMDASTISDDMKAMAKTPQQLQGELLQSNSSASMAAMVQKANGFDANIAPLVGRQHADLVFDHSESVQTKRQEIISQLQTNLGEIDKIPKSEMSKDDRKEFKVQVEDEIGAIQHTNGIPAALQAATQAMQGSQPAVAAPGAKRDFSVAPQ